MKIITHQVDGVWVRFPGTPQLDPRKVARLVEDGVWTWRDLQKNGLQAATPFSVPQGKVVVGDERFSIDGKAQLFDVEDSPPVEPERRMVRKSTIIARLTDAQLEAAMGLMTIRQQERWRAPDQPTVHFDDPETVAVVTAVGADPAVVLREGEEA